MKPKYLFFMLICLLATACTVSPRKTPEKIAALPTTTTTAAANSIATTNVFPATWTPTATLVPSLTPTITLSPTITTSPTRKPTRTPLPTFVDDPSVDSLASTLIRLSDLPAGFKEMPMNQAEMQPLPLEEQGLAAMVMALYANEQNGSSVFSTSFGFSDMASQTLFDYSTDHFEDIMEEQFDELGVSEMGLEFDIQVISNFPIIGDKSAALHIELELNEIKSYMEMAIFRQDGYGGILMITHPLIGSSSLDLRELTLLQHGRIMAFLNGGS